GTRYDSLFYKPDPNGLFAVGRSGTDDAVVGYRGCLEVSCGTLLISDDGGLTFTTDSLWNPAWPVIATAITETGVVFAQSFAFAVKRRETSGWGGASSVPGFPEDFARIIPLHGDSLFAATFDGMF